MLIFSRFLLFLIILSSVIILATIAFGTSTTDGTPAYQNPSMWGIAIFQLLLLFFAVTNWSDISKCVSNS